MKTMAMVVAANAKSSIRARPAMHAICNDTSTIAAYGQPSLHCLVTEGVAIPVKAFPIKPGIHSHHYPGT